MASDIASLENFCWGPQGPSRSHISADQNVFFSTAISVQKHLQIAVKHLWWVIILQFQGAFYRPPWTLSKQMFRRGRQVFQVDQAPSGPTVIRQLLIQPLGVSGALRQNTDCGSMSICYKRVARCERLKANLRHIDILRQQHRLMLHQRVDQHRWTARSLQCNFRHEN